MFKTIEVMLPERVPLVDFSVLKETVSWIHNRKCPNNRRIYVVMPDGEMIYRDHPSWSPAKRQHYFVEFVFRDGSTKLYRLWRGVFIQFHLALYAFLDKKKAKTLEEANMRANNETK